MNDVEHCNKEREEESRVEVVRLFKLLRDNRRDYYRLSKSLSEARKIEGQLGRGVIRHKMNINLANQKLKCMNNINKCKLELKELGVTL